MWNIGMGSSIKYVTLFLANFEPPPPVTLCHTSRDPPKVRHTSRTPPIFSRPSTKNLDKNPLYKFSLNCSRGFLFGGFVRGSFVWKVLFGVVFIRSPSVRIHLLRQKVKHHFKFFFICTIKCFISVTSLTPFPPRA